MATDYYTDRQLAERFGVSRSCIWRWKADDQVGFPKPIPLGPQITRWKRTDIEDWEAARAAA